MKRIATAAFMILFGGMNGYAQFGGAARQRLPVDYRVPVSAGEISDRLVDIRLGDITLQAIDFRSQTARLQLGFDLTNRVLPLRIKDFDYRLSLFDRPAIQGNYDGTLKLGGKTPSRINLPVEVSLRAIPETLWSAFSNRGLIRYQLDSGFTLPLLIMEKRVDKSFSGQVPVRSLVDAASILRARALPRILG